MKLERKELIQDIVDLVNKHEHTNPKAASILAGLAAMIIDGDEDVGVAFFTKYSRMQIERRAAARN